MKLQLLRRPMHLSLIWSESLLAVSRLLCEWVEEYPIFCTKHFKTRGPFGDGLIPRP